MSEEAGSSASAFTAAQAALSARHEAVAAADQTLASAVAGAHAVTVEALSRLDAIGAEIEDAVSHQYRWSLDTPAGTREFQHFLLARHRDIIAVVSDATARSTAAAAELGALLDRYRLGDR